MLSRFILLYMLLYPCTVQAQSKPADFVYLAQVIPSIQVELRYYSANNFIGRPVDGYRDEVLIITTQAAEALQKVQAELAYTGLGLKIFDAYRPQQAVDHFARWANDVTDTRMKQQYYPNVGKRELIPLGFIAERSGHSRGSTVDLTIISLEDGRELDMGCFFDFFDRKSWPSDRTVGVQQRANRQFLRSLMTKHGFIPLEEEWWHFTLADEPFPDTYFDFPVQ